MGGSVWLCNFCPVHPLHPTQRECRSWHCRQAQLLETAHFSSSRIERLTHLPQDPHSWATLPPSCPLLFKGQLSSSSALCLLPVIYTVWGPTTCMRAPAMWVKRVKQASSGCQSFRGQDMVWQASKGSGPKVCWWDSRHSRTARKDDSLTGQWLSLKYSQNPEEFMKWETLGILHLTCTNRTPWVSAHMSGATGAMWELNNASWDKKRALNDTTVC